MKKLISVLLLFSGSVWAFKNYGNPNAPQGGTFYLSQMSGPTTLNPFSSTDYYASEVASYVIDGLLIRDPETYEFVPWLAESYDVSKDGKKITFKLRKGIKFHNGDDFTAEDVKFTLGAMRNPEYKAATKLPYLENIDRVEIIDPYTVEFHIKKPYFGNLEAVSDFSTYPIVPRKMYEDPKAKLNKKLVGTGPYMLEKFETGKEVILKKNPNWWGAKVPELKGMYNFDKIHIKITGEETIELEMMKKGDLDYMTMSSEKFMKNTNGPMWGKTVFKEQVQNSQPMGYAYFAWNQKNPLFQSKKVRHALAQLTNRRLMIKKFSFDMSLPATGPWYQQSPYAPKDVKPFEFEPQKAGQLLAEEGWKDTDKDGLLDKVIDGKKVNFQFTILNPNKEWEKYLTIYKEDLKKAGIEMNIKYVDFNSLVKMMDDRKFDALTLAWSAGSVDTDPKQIWHSESMRAGGSNFISYSNKEVDDLIDKGRAELNREKRIKIYHDIYRKIADDAPYVFLFNSKYIFYARSNKVKNVKPVYNYMVGTPYWYKAQ